MFDPSKLDLELDPNAPSKETSTPSSGLADALISDTGGQAIEENNTLHGNTDTLGEDNKNESFIDPLMDLPEIDSKTQDLYIDNNTQAYEVVESESEHQAKDTQSAIIFDINTCTLLDIFQSLEENKYDFVTISPSELSATITFKKEGVIDVVKHIKYPIYTAIILKAKAMSKLQLDETDKAQEGKGSVQLKDKHYQVISKIVPSDFGEKLFLKIKETKKKLVPKQKQKVSIGKIMGFFGAGIFALLIIGAAFLAFILFSANNVADLTFFNNLGVNVASIKEFTSKLVDFIFFTILLLESILLFSLLFKAFLTKKEFKQKKISRMIMAFSLLVLTMITGFIWLSLSKKINTLNSQDYGKVLFYDNSKYLSQVFDEVGAKININDALIGPVMLRFDIQQFMKQIIDSGFIPQNLTWLIDNQEIESSLKDYEFIREFKTKGITDVVIRIEGTNIKGEEDIIEREVAKVNIAQMIEITEDLQRGGGSIFDFNATSLENLGKVKWFYIPNLKGKDESEQRVIINKALEKETIKGYRFTSKIIYDQEVIVGMQLTSKQDTDQSLDKIFIISKENTDTISGEIIAIRDKINDLKYSFSISGADTAFGDGNIESFLWEVDGKPTTLQADLSDLDASSLLEYEFSKYGDFIVSVTITDSRGKTKILSKTIEIPKNLKLLDGLIISENNEILEDISYNPIVNEYQISDIGIPTKLKLDTRNLGVDNKLYTLKQAYWDYNGDGDFDEIGKVGNLSLDTPGAQVVIVEYEYVHRILKDTVVRFKQTLFIDTIKKEALVLFDIKKPSSYTPVIVSFDASQSQIKDGNIQKFIWDYGDGVIEERDAIVPGHKYTRAGDYDIKLQIVGEDGKMFEKTKKLILKPKPQNVEITASLKSAPVGQEIDFSSQKSEGQITSYLWKFGDGEVSSGANPSYQYRKVGQYTVELIIEFSNNNVQTDTVTIDITSE